MTMSEDYYKHPRSISMQCALYWDNDSGKLFYKHFSSEPVEIGTINNLESWRLLMRHVEERCGFFYYQGLEDANFGLDDTIKCQLEWFKNRQNESDG